MAQPGASSMTIDVRGFLHRLFFRDAAEHADVAERVKQEAAQLRSTAVAVREQWNRYASTKDPFVAMVADIYERRQEALIYKEALKDWRGPPA